MLWDNASCYVCFEEQGHLWVLAALLNPGRFGPIPFRSGRFGPGRFGPISGVSRFGPVGAGRFGPIS